MTTKLEPSHRPDRKSSWDRKSEGPHIKSVLVLHDAQVLRWKVSSSGNFHVSGGLPGKHTN